jgi:membrane protein YdbS with pleckstrin-like domain
VQRHIDPQRIYAITRPEPILLTLYVLRSLAGLVFFPLIFAPLLIRYLTLHYRFDEESIRKSYGFIFKKEDLVQYSRIQDLHLKRSLVQRWLGLANIEIQTASGSAVAELTIEGLTNYEELRDFFYSKMRGARFGEKDGVEVAAPPVQDNEALKLLTEIRDEIRSLRGQRP